MQVLVQGPARTHCLQAEKGGAWTAADVVQVVEQRDGVPACLLRVEVDGRAVPANSPLPGAPAVVRVRMTGLKGGKGGCVPARCTRPRLAGRSRAPRPQLRRHAAHDGQGVRRQAHHQLWLLPRPAGAQVRLAHDLNSPLGAIAHSPPPAAQAAPREQRDQTAQVARQAGAHPPGQGLGRRTVGRVRFAVRGRVC